MKSNETGSKLKLYYFFYRSNVLNIHCQKHYVENSWNGEEENDNFWQCFDYFSDVDVESIHHSDE